MHLKVSNLRKSYDKLVLDSVSYDFYKGKIYAVLGRNGAGKTTFFNCLNKDVSYEEGTVSLVEDGLERELEFDDIGLVSASPVLPEFLTGYEFIHYFMKLNTKALVGDRQAIDDYFDLMRIEKEDRFKLIKTYSHGMKNKLQLLSSLIRKQLQLILHTVGIRISCNCSPLSSESQR